MPEPIQNALLALAFLACGGLHIVLRLLSLHLCNEYPSLPKKKKKKEKKKVQPSILAKAHIYHQRAQAVRRDQFSRTIKKRVKEVYTCHLLAVLSLA